MRHGGWPMKSNRAPNITPSKAGTNPPQYFGISPALDRKLIRLASNLAFGQGLLENGTLEKARQLFKEAAERLISQGNLEDEE
jgi:hypothetical protein